MVLKRAVHFTIRKLWLTIGILLVLFAVALSIARIALPYAENYRASIEEQIQQRFGQDVTIGGLSAEWTARGPVLVLQDLAFELVDDYPLQLDVQRANVQLNFWQSMMQRDWVFEHFVLSGMRVDYAFTPLNGDQDRSLPAALENLFLRQLEHFQIRDSEFTLRIGEQAPRTIQIDALTWRREGERRQATGLFRIPDVTANSLNFIADIDGDEFSTLSGDFYVEAQQLDISPWLKQVTPTSEILRAEFNLQGWLNLVDGEFRSGQLELGENHLEWRRDREHHRLNTRPSTWSLQPRTDGWLMNSTPLMISLDGRDWPLERVIWQYRQGEHRWNLTDIELFDFAPLWSLFGRPGQLVADWSDGLQAEGILSQVQVQLSPAREWQFYVRADDLGWKAYQGVPGMEGLALEIWSTDRKGRFALTGAEVALASPSTFADAKKLTELSVEGYWFQQNGSWEFGVPEAYFSLPNADVRQSMRFRSDNGKPVQAEWLLSGGSRGMDVFDVVALLPLQLGEDLANYLDGALEQGQIDTLGMVWRGPLDGLPYQPGQGVLQARTVIRDLDFQFRPEWPPILGTEAELTFEYDSLFITTRGGTLADIPLGEVRAEISPLIAQGTTLHVAADVDSDRDALHALFAQSPLADSVATTLDVVKPRGRLQGAFTLDIPFYEGGELVAEGRVDLDGNSIEITPVGLTLDAVQGELTFRNGAIRFHTDDAALFELPISVSLTGRVDDEIPYRIAADIYGAWASDAIQSAFPDTPLLEQFSGRMEHQAEFKLDLLSEGFNYRWDMTTQLADTGIQLPAPLGKAAGTSRTLVTEVRGNQTELTAESRMGDLLQVRGNMPLGQGFDALEFVIGESPVPIAASPTSGFSIYFGLGAAALEDWLPIVVGLTRLADNVPCVPEFEGEVCEPGLRLIPALHRVEGRVDALASYGQDFGETQIQGSAGDARWAFDINGENLRARLSGNDESDALAVNIDFLELTRVPEDTSEQQVVRERDWLDSLPKMTINCRLCRYDGQLLGEITANFDPQISGGQVTDLTIRRGNTRVRGGLGWVEANGETRTRVQGRFETSDVGALLGEFGVNSTVRESSANLQYDLNWQGGLLDWNADTLSGQVDWSLGQGYLRDVSDGAARIFAVLSLESILRRFTLDFRDIFSRGMHYQSFGGTLELEDGVVRTENTRMNGVAGDMTVRGHANLRDETLDYQITYVPKVTSSLPVLLAFMVNPPSGIAALVIDRMLHDAQVISRLQYHVTGSMSDPVVTEVRRDATDVELPEVAEDVLPRDLPEHTEATRENSGG